MAKKLLFRKGSFGLDCTGTSTKKCDGKFIFQGTEKVIRLGVKMLKTSYACDECDATSIRHRSMV